MSTVLDHFQHIRFDKKHAWHRSMILLYCTIIEYADSIYVLVTQQNSVSLPIVTRSILEAFVDLMNLCDDPSYGNHLQADDIKEWLRVAKEAQTTSNPYLKEMVDADGFDVQVIQWEDEFKALGHEGFRPLNQITKFEKAGLANEYRSVYNFLCVHTHNNLRALHERHIEISDDKRDFNIVIFHDFDPKLIEQYIPLVCRCIIECSIKVHATIGTGYEDAFKTDQ
ncbi:DUF5677 domain-containing protein [Pseudohongiella sp.]|uniref:Uncharacterized protein n=1 Tax=marine sediment metagenome TaxID=412755 RepID=A0A0F9WHZ2_9ZZZZ|nr:DUF5677 domain-containing protein [Pseudohongiella sp.]HDZ07738.1 hypothetical protein [Pseudohongiella sp.]